LRLLGGKQDQYAAAFGGVNFIEFYGGNKVIVNPLRIKRWVQCELEDSLLLYFTGKSRQSARIIGQQMNAMESGESLQAMHDLKKGAVHMKEALLTGDFEKFADSLREGWEAKKRTSDVISSGQMDGIYAKAIEAGAKAGKLSGAGGGGFFMFYIDPTRREAVKQALEEFEGKTYTVQLTEHGTRGWIV
jgi:D-glycero-alpha-D-manno-heptose-7-phosphate kinase